MNSSFNRVENLSGWNEFDDVELLEHAKLGQSEAYGELYERYSRAVFRYIFAHLNNRMDAEDLTEEVFLRVYRTISSYREQGVPFLAFLFKVARNVLIDFYRQTGRAGGHMSIEEKSFADYHTDPGETAIANLEHQEVRQTLEKLRDDYRTVLILRFLSGLSPEETGEVMGRTPGAVRILQHRALTALRNLLEI
jgi:RNA polymerase sigma-70 factor (ECF subfamily)